jgi:two-component system chemotaxis sensor kinase CheA
VLDAGGSGRAAFAVDAVVGEQEIIIKSLGSQLARVRNVEGAALMGSGSVVPVLNVRDLMKSAVEAAGMHPFAAAVEEKEAERKSVLVVEDSITSRTLLRNIIESAGYLVDTAVDGMEAVEALRTGAYSLVVSDVDMPRMNGFELTEKVRADRRTAEIPVVLVTALESREDRERGIDAGADAYIVKSSFDRGNLLEVIRRLL